MLDWSGRLRVDGSFLQSLTAILPRRSAPDARGDAYVFGTRQDLLYITPHARRAALATVLLSSSCRPIWSKSDSVRSRSASCRVPLCLARRWRRCGRLPRRPLRSAKASPARRRAAEGCRWLPGRRPAGWTAHQIYGGHENCPDRPV